MQKKLFHGLNLPQELSSAIKAYNETSDKQPLNKLFYLQQLSYQARELIARANEQVIDWYYQEGETGLEQHLQYYQIHRDASELVNTIEFARAVAENCTDSSTAPQNKSFYEILRDRNALFLTTDKTEKERLHDYIHNNLSIWALYSYDESMQVKVIRQINVLALIYGKMEVIQGFVDQQFDDYTSSAMTANSMNNQNFIFTVNDTKLVIRVEGRNSLGIDRQLQTYPVSDYFTEEYATLMIPFADHQYRPVVFSEFAEEGNLEHYARSLVTNNPDEILEKTVTIFSQIADFCLKLMESGHYHPDIKLTNFLLHNGKLRVSDRKTILDKRVLKANLILSSYNFAPPEYQECFFISNKQLVMAKMTKISRTEIDMAAFMSFQVGGVLREFIHYSHSSFPDNANEELKHRPITELQEHPSSVLSNLAALINALTQSIPSERLSINQLPTLLQKINSSNDEFLMKLNDLTPTPSSRDLKVNLDQKGQSAKGHQTLGPFCLVEEQGEEEEAEQDDEERKRDSFYRIDINLLHNENEQEKAAELKKAIQSIRAEERLIRKLSIIIEPAQIAAHVAQGDRLSDEQKKQPIVTIDPNASNDKPESVQDPILGKQKEGTNWRTVVYAVVYTFLGASSGAVIGAVVGSFIPVIGTVIGGLIGGCLGATLTYGLYLSAVENGHQGIWSVPNYLKEQFNPNTTESSEDNGLKVSAHDNTVERYKTMMNRLGASAIPSPDARQEVNPPKENLTQPPSNQPTEENDAGSQSVAATNERCSNFQPL